MPPGHGPRLRLPAPAAVACVYLHRPLPLACVFAAADADERVLRVATATAAAGFPGVAAGNPGAAPGAGAGAGGGGGAGAGAGAGGGLGGSSAADVVGMLTGVFGRCVLVVGGCTYKVKLDRNKPGQPKPNWRSTGWCTGGRGAVLEAGVFPALLGGDWKAVRFRRRQTCCLIAPSPEIAYSLKMF